MPLLAQLERRFGRYAVENPTLWLVIGQAAVYFGDRLSPQQGAWSERLALMPALVMQGEVWRLLTFVFVPTPMSPLWILLYLSALYYFGQSIEAIWGAVRYNAYLLVGLVATAAAAWLDPHQWCDAFYLKTSLFLAFATLLPDTPLAIYFIIPVKAKWLALLTWLSFAVWFYHGDWPQRMMILAAVTNYFLFFGRSAFFALSDWRRRAKFQRQLRTGSAGGILQHECRVCGLTSEMAPKLAFRYCSQCAGTHCYCPDHLRSHEHVTPAENNR